MTEKLSGVTVIIIIGGGVLTFIILFIFAKRQIMRFALRSRRGPHCPIGHGAKKSLRREIDRRIETIPRIAHEPRLLAANAAVADERFIVDPPPHRRPPGAAPPPSSGKLPAHYHRLRAVDDVKALEKEIGAAGGARAPCESLRAYLLNALAAQTGQRAVHRLCDMYEHARHDPADFGDDEYRAFGRLLLKLIDAARLLKPFGHKASPNRTPTRKQTSRPLLDPSRLKPAAAPPPTNRQAISNIHSQYTSMQDSAFENNFDEILCVEAPTSVLIHTHKTDNETPV